MAESAEVTLRPKSGAGRRTTQEKERPRLTDASIKKLPTPEEGNRITYDADVPGFGIRITSAGARSFVLNYRTRAGRERRYTIGGFPDWQTTAARESARELKRLIDAGGDPMADIEAEREAATVAGPKKEGNPLSLCDRFEQEHMPRKRAGTATDYKRMLNKHIRPHFGVHLRVADVAFEDIDRLHRKITAAGHPYRANRVIAVLSKMFSLAIHWKMRTDNPCKGIERNLEEKRKRYLKEEPELGHELVRLTKALAAYPDQRIADIFRLLLLTGARRGEVLAMRWADLALDAVNGKSKKKTGTWSKPASTTKQATDHVVPLSEPARQLLCEIREQAKKKALGEYVFPGAGSSKHIVSIKRAWKTICESANIVGLRIHDLRHSYASFLANAEGASLPLIGALLGHSNPATTARYAHLFDDPQRAATERVSDIIMGAGQPKKKPASKRQPKRRP
jgi:integrase